ncbi:MAG: tRNA 2-thiouridine(34) synthase MnmA [Anaerolineales bacterium]
MIPRRKIAVAMSGGVDSSIAAALLVEQGEQVFGLMLRLWDSHPDRPNRCCSPRDLANARAVAAQLEIPFYVLDVREAFRQAVVEPFIAGYLEGITPNPCMSCNRQIRWGHLLRHARQLGATHLATGHYARIQESGGQYQLFRPRDRAKDQSYVLSVLGQADLEQSFFPLGELEKDQVREFARELRLPVAERPDSQDLCFLGGADYRDFLRDTAGVSGTPGPIIDQAGLRLGAHQGLPDYTVGQRKGIGVSAAVPLYVIDKDFQRNTLVVGPREALARTAFSVDRLHWVAGRPPEPETCLSVQVRYRSAAVRARLQPNGDLTSAEIQLDEPLLQITPGQAAVFYAEEECLGGGVIFQ